MKHWQFYLAILLLVVLLLPRYEGMSSYPFELSPSQKKIQQKLNESTEKERLELEDEIIRIMSPIQMQKIPEIKKENYNVLYKIVNLSLDEIHEMTPKEIDALNEPHFDALLRRIKKLNGELTSEQIGGLSESRIKYMGPI